jgi:hypothetical protein
MLLLQNNVFQEITYIPTVAQLNVTKMGQHENENKFTVRMQN